MEASAESLLEAKKATSKTYDLFVAGVNLGYLGTYMSPYFHSGQVQNGFNFALLRNPNLDPLLEELASKYLPKENKDRIFSKVTEILRKEQALIPLQMNRTEYIIDSLVKDFTPVNYMPSVRFLKESIIGSYIK